jgi:hypothetical protein
MIPIKIECGCGQKYAFDIEPLCGRMPGRVTCPVCGLDGTRVANEIIAYNLAAELAVEKSGPNIVMIFAVIGCLLAGVAGVIKALSMKDGVNVLLCLLGASVAFALALAVYFWKR